ncbi:unnamed protein product [Penicillium bialowiezense]
MSQCRNVAKRQARKARKRLWPHKSPPKRPMSSAFRTRSNNVHQAAAREAENRADEAFTKRFESRQQLESYISRVELLSSSMLSLPAALSR